MNRLFLAILLVSFSASAQFKDLLKKVAPPPQQGTTQKKNTAADWIVLGAKTAQAMMPIGWEEEQAIGGAVALEAVARFGGLWINPEVERYVATVGTAVALTSDRVQQRIASLGIQLVSYAHADRRPVARARGVLT